MSIPTVLQHTDTGAPDLTGEDGSLYNVLKWALPQLGWSIEFDNGSNKIAFRNNTTNGSGYYFQVTDVVGEHASNAKRAKVSGFSAMTALDTGNDEFPPTGTEQYFFKSHVLDATPQEWIIIGTETIFYFGSWNPETNRSLGYRIFWAGDFIPYSVNDPSPFTIGSYADLGNATDELVTPIREVTYGNDSIQRGAARSANIFALNYNDLTPGQEAGWLVATPGVNTISNVGSWEPGTEGPYPDPITQSLNLSRIEAQIEFTPGSGEWFRRASMPGILVPMSNVAVDSGSPLNNLDVLSGLSNGNETIDGLFIFGSKFHGLSNSNSGKQAFVFDTTSDWSNW